MIDARMIATSSMFSGMDGDVTESLDEHEERFGLLQSMLPAQLLQSLETSGLSGRGGAGFPAARKWESVRRHASGTGRSPLVIANGSEGEPCSWKDSTLLVLRPHLVLDGLDLAADALEASETYIYLPDDRSVVTAVEQAIAERHRRYRGRKPRLIVAPPRYVAGEESAVISRIEGRAAKPLFRKRPYEDGVWSRPTLINNVETLARAALVARGIPAGGRALVTVSGSVRSPGVVDVEVGTTLRVLLDAVGGGSGTSRAYLLGGYFGQWLPAEGSDNLRIGVDVPLGAGVLAVVDTQHCPIAETAVILRYLARESAQQCGPCIYGLPALAETLTALTRPGGPKARLDLLQSRLEQIQGRGACHHPDGAVMLTQSLLKAFAPDVNRHWRNGPCRACSAEPLLPAPASGGRWK